MGDAPLEAGLSGEMQALYQRILRLQSMGHTAAAAAAPYMGLALAALDGDDSPWSDELRRNTGERLKAARDRLGLSQVAVAQKSGLSERTIKNLEAGMGQPSQETLSRLLWLLALPEGRPAASAELRPNSWLAPQYDCAKLNEELSSAVNGTGGTIEQTLLYVDPKSALAWLEISRSSRLVEQFWDRCPVAQIAEHIASALLAEGAASAEVIALGCGDGRNEIRLTDRLREGAARLPLRLCLLDISHLLLTEANNEAQRMLGGREVEVVTLHANFHRLARYPELNGASGPRPRRIWTLFGYTLSNLEAEPPFFDTLEACAQTGDWLLLDFQLTHAPAEQPELVRARDPGLRPDAPVADHLRWLTSPFVKLCRDYAGMEVVRLLDTAVPVPGSYAINWRAEVRLRTGQTRVFGLARSRRYDAGRLTEWLVGRGWGRPTVLTYGAGEQPRQAVLLLQRT